RHDRRALGAGGLDGTAHERGAEPTATELLPDLGVVEDPLAVALAEVGVTRHLAAGLADLEHLVCRRTLDLHGRAGLVGVLGHLKITSRVGPARPGCCGA